MRFRLSTNLILGLVYLGLVVVGQWLAYSVSSSVLDASVRGREIDKVNTLANLIRGQIAERGRTTRLIAQMVAADQAVAQAVLLKPVEQASRFAAELEGVFSLNRLKTLEVTDTSEQVIYRAQLPTVWGGQAEGWGVAEALGGQGLVVSHRHGEAVLLQAIEPLRVGGEVVGTVIAGTALDESFFENLGGDLGANLLLMSRKGPVWPTGKFAVTNMDAGSLSEAFESKVAIYRVDAANNKTSVFLPITVVDEAYVVLAQIDSRGAADLIQQGQRQSALYALIIGVASALLGLLILRVVLGPLRLLRVRAEKVALELTGVPIEVKGKDEVAAVVEVLDTLTGRLMQRNRNLAQAHATAEGASLAKSRFLSSMSHEIRTPLNGVLGMAELLRDTPLSRDQVRFVGAIESAGRVLHGLLSDILDLAKIEEGQVKLERIDFDPRQTMLDLSSVFTEMAASRSISLQTDVNALQCTWAAGDPTRFRQVLSNLLSNAMKFTPRGEIRLRGESIASPPGDARPWCRVSVEDTGIGMTPEALTRLFQRFEQADVSTTRNFGGSGLGLAISKHLVELMGGQVHVSSELGKGSRFWFDLPFEAPLTAGAPAILEVDKVELKGINVLVAEDNPINQLVVKTLLTRLGAEITLVENGELALQEMMRGGFDLVFMDCQMPVMDGFEATRHIRIWERSQPGKRALPIVALTANALAGDREACLAAGMTDYVTKPVTSAALLQAMERNRPRLLATLAPITTAAAIDPVPGVTTVAATEPENPAEPDDPAEPDFDPAPLAGLPMVLDGSDPGFVDEMLDLFCADTRQTLDAIDNATHEVDIPTLTRLVHTLKSSAAQVGAMALSVQAKHQEALLRDGQMGAADWRDRLKHAFARFERALAQHRAARSTRVSNP